MKDITLDIKNVIINANRILEGKLYISNRVFICVNGLIIHLLGPLITDATESNKQPQVS